MHCDDEAALLLASLALQAEYGDYQPEVGVVFSSEIDVVLVDLFLSSLSFVLFCFVVGNQSQSILDKHFPPSYICSFCFLPLIVCQIMVDVMIFLKVILFLKVPWLTTHTHHIR